MISQCSILGEPRHGRSRGSLARLGELGSLRAVPDRDWLVAWFGALVLCRWFAIRWRQVLA